jgi:hypothetical protein
MTKDFTKWAFALLLLTFGSVAYAQPGVKSVQVLGLDSVVVEFDQFVNSSASTTSNYTFTPSVSIANITFDSLNKKAVLKTNLTSGKYYSLEVDKVEDASGTAMSAASKTDDLVFNTYNGSAIVITEIMYNDSSGPDNYEFVEIYNSGSSTIEIGGLALVEGVTFTFPEYSFAAGSLVVIAKNVDSVKMAFDVTAIGQFGGGLSNSGEDVDIRNSYGDILDVVDFDDGNGWETRADGSGPSLQLQSHRLNVDSNNMADNWYVDYNYSYVNNWGTSYCTPGFLPRTLVPLGEISQVDANGVNTTNGAVVTATGIVHGVNMRSSGLQITIIDNSGGIGVFNSSKNYGYSVNEGDSVWVSGTISQFNGLSQFSPLDSIAKVGSSKAFNPEIVVKPSEYTESRLVKVLGVTVVTSDGAWKANANYSVTNGTDTFVVRIDGDTDLGGKTIPSGPINITGIGGQFDNSNPYTSGYQLFPRYSSDIELGGSGPSPVITFGASAASVDEDAKTYSVEMSISNPNANATTLELFISGGTAINGTDYNASLPITVSFPGSSSAKQSVLITILDNSAVDSDRTIEFQMRNLTNDAKFGSDSILILTIKNDDLTFTKIDEITLNDPTGFPTIATQKVKTRGLVYGVNLRTSGVQFTLIDETGGVGIIDFSKTFGYNVREGDEIIVQGVVGFYNGLTQIQELDTIILDNDQKVPKNPVVVTMLDESTESELVKLERVWFVDDMVTEWPSNGNINVTNGTDTFVIRIDREVIDLAGQPVPIFDTMNISGLGNQFDAVSPYDEGYQLFPRYSNDIEEYTDAGSITQFSSDLKIYPNPAKDLIHIISTTNISNVRMMDAMGRVVLENNAQSNMHKTLNVSMLTPGMYLIQAQMGATQSIQRIMIK